MATTCRSPKSRTSSPRAAERHRYGIAFRSHHPCRGRWPPGPPCEDRRAGTGPRRARKRRSRRLEREPTCSSSPVSSKRGQNIVGKRTGGRSAPTTVNSSVRTREYLTTAEIERLMAAARKSSRYGHRDATMILVVGAGFFFLLPRVL